ncbi:MAG: deoxyguanosinetriphosphate triphosphohydrolase, partial [Anaerolineae bacterium]|nr:deoxyguanosinetriphosphate triphosphohydrolase [Anaerolineae bacterium]
MRTRQQLEEIEHLTLAPYAAKSAETRGRQHTEDEAPYRTAFQRDRERVLHTTAFRRLQGKTQVFVVTEGDYYRTRITHTMEVAQIGRTIARSLGANEDLVEGICLSHDLGHPPFGHSGETTLDGLMKGHGGFNHNQHSFRIVTELEHRYPQWPGLNLTYEFREGIAKHETDYDVATPHDYEPKLRGTLESQIASFADELAYNAHDLDDGLRAGLLNWHEVCEVGWVQQACEAAQVADRKAFDDLVRHRVVRKLVGLMVTALVEESSTRIEHAGVQSLADVRKQPQVLVGFDAAASALNTALKSFLFEKLYRHYRVIRMTSKAERVLTDLFKAYLSEPRILPDGTRARLKQYPLERVVCNYIAGIDDRFALDEHA